MGAQKSLGAVKSQVQIMEAEAISIEQRVTKMGTGGQEVHRNQRAGRSNAGWPWEQRRHIAPGCGPDYIPVGQKNVRLWATGNQVANEVKEDPIVTMEEGIPVLLYHPVHHSFERRVLKVDNKLHFMYMLAEAASLHGSAQAGKCQDPITMRLHQICSVWDAADAMRICEACGVSDSHLTIDSAVVVQYGDKDQPMPSLEKIFVFMAAPQQKLKACIEACWSSCGVDVDEDAEVKLKKATTRAQPKVKPKVKGPLARISGVLLRDVKEVFNRDQATFNLQVLLKPDNRPVTIAANTCLPAQAETEALRASTDAGHNLAAIDAARVSFVLRDVSALREWATGKIPAAFDGKLWDFLPDEKGLGAVVHRNQEFQDAMTELQSMDTGPATDVYGEASVRSSLQALRQLMELETKFADLVDRGRALGISTPDTRVTLSHQFVPVGLESGAPAIADVAASPDHAHGSAPLDSSVLSAEVTRESTYPASPQPLGVLASALESAEPAQGAPARPLPQGVTPLQLSAINGFPQPDNGDASAGPAPQAQGVPGDAWARVDVQSTEKAVRSDEDHPRSRCAPGFCGTSKRGPPEEDQTLIACAGMRGAGKDCSVQ